MPGVCLDVGRESRGFDEALERLLHSDTYSHETSLSTPSVALGHTAHPGYPVTVVETDEHILYIEGALYDVSDRAETLRSVAPLLLEPRPDEFAAFLRDTDGEFLIVAVDRQTGDVAIANDLFGRLPVYHRRTDHGFVASREPGFVLDTATSVSFDRMGLAQTLLFGYTLGERTLWEGVSRLPPATQLLVNTDGDVTEFTHHEFNFEDKQHRDRSVQQNAQELASRFRDACQNRAALWDRNVLSLSGGLDSRAVLGGLRSSDASFSAATFEQANGSTERDRTISAEIAASENLDWELYSLSPRQAGDMSRLLDLKEGLNSITMGYILEFFERLVDANGSQTVYHTGDGGDKTLPDISPGAEIRDREAFISYLISENAVFPLSAVTALTGVTPTEMRDEIDRVVSAYPESNWNDAYVHFLVHERGVNWLFEGEDRNRCFFWSTSPFYAPDFFRYAMNVPHEQKARYELYRQFFEELWPEALTFDHADFRSSPGSMMYKGIQYGLELIDGHPRVESLVSELHHGTLGSEYHPNLSGLLRRQASSCDAVKQLFAEDVLEEISQDRRSYGTTQLYTLLTLTSAVERRGCNQSTLAHNAEVTFE